LTKATKPIASGLSELYRTKPISPAVSDMVGIPASFFAQNCVVKSQCR
jgi:hypothetical protein